MHNVARDTREKGELLFSFMDTLTWWLQPEIKRELAKQKTSAWPMAADYIQELKKAGASDEYVAKEIATLPLQDGQDEGDIVMLRGPANG